jgi:endoglycosylceramidase
MRRWTPQWWWLAILATAGCASDYVLPGGFGDTDAAGHDASGVDMATDAAPPSDTANVDSAGPDDGGGTLQDAAGIDVATVDAPSSDVSVDSQRGADVSMDAPSEDGGIAVDTGPGAHDVNSEEPDPPLEPPSLSTRRLTTRGNVLIDELGRTVILRGVNIGGRSKMPPFLPFDITNASEISGKADRLMSAVRSLGANAVRLTFSWEALETVRGTFDAEYVRRYRLLLDAAQRAELFVIVDFHQDVFHAAFCGDGFPEWALGNISHGPPHYDCSFPFWSLPYFDPASPVSQAFDRFWSNTDGLLDAFEAMWRHVAREVGRHPVVAAFEVLNEPGSGSTALTTAGATVLPPFYDRMAGIIEAEAGPAAIIGDEPVSSTADVQYLARPSHARFAYGPHYYDGATMLNIGPLDAARIRTAVSAVLARAGAWNAPTIVGEFGAPNAVSFKADYLAAIFDALDAGRASGLLWDVSLSAQRWNNEDFGPLLPDGTELPWAGLLDRPTPRAIDGTITSFTWDTVTRRFNLTVTGAGDVISEVYLPVRQLGMTPDIAVTGARYRWLAATGRLLVAAPRGAAWSLTAVPR